MDVAELYTAGAPISMDVIELYTAGTAIAMDITKLCTAGAQTAWMLQNCGCTAWVHQ